MCWTGDTVGKEFSMTKPAGTAVKAEIRREATGFRLYRAGEPYFIKGAVYWADPDGKFPLRGVAERGGNSVRCGGTHVARILDAAAELRMTATVGLPLKMESVHGFDYDDKAAVRAQFEEMRELIERYRNHPALLMWGVGNELSVRYTNRNCWDAVNEIAEMIHELDPNHPAMTVVGGGAFGQRDDIQQIIRRCPAIDVLGLNLYRELEEAPELIRAEGWPKPYAITEWGPTGHWQVPKTKWKLPIEETSTEKAERYLSRYQGSVLRDRERCLGSYCFMWGQKQEQTHTWYGMFTSSGERNEAVHVMEYLWTGRWPSNRAPAIGALRVDDRPATDSLALEPGTTHAAVVCVEDPDRDPMSFEWELLPEPTQFGYGGRGERKPDPIGGIVVENRGRELRFQAPAASGNYRLFVTVRDGQGNAATANFPFHVGD